MKRIVMWVVAGLIGSAGMARGQVRPLESKSCRRVVVEGELRAGQEADAAVGGGLKVHFQAIASGWILRVLPLASKGLEHDYAELATPPYQSVSPLSLSTDFAFRAQDAVGWNPRRFRFATSDASYRQLLAGYGRLTVPGARPPAEVEAQLAHALQATSEGTLTILDARLIAGTADQAGVAAAVASHFSTTAHSLVTGPGEGPTPLGRLVWIRYRLALDVPPGFRAASGVRSEPRACALP